MIIGLVWLGRLAYLSREGKFEPLKSTIPAPNSYLGARPDFKLQLDRVKREAYNKEYPALMSPLVKSRYSNNCDSFFTLLVAGFFLSGGYCLWVIING